MTSIVSRREFLVMGGLTTLAATLPPAAGASEPAATPAAAAALTPGGQRMKVHFSDPQFDYQLLRLLGGRPAAAPTSANA